MACYIDMLRDLISKFKFYNIYFTTDKFIKRVIKQELNEWNYITYNENIIMGYCSFTMCA